MNGLFDYDPKTDGSKGLVFIGNKILVYRRDHNTQLFPGYLDLPGGGPEADETPFENFKREVKEEFNLEIEPEDIVYFRKYQSSLHKDKSTYFPVAKLPFKAVRNIIFGNEGSEHLLMTSKEFLIRTDAWPEMQRRTKIYLEWQKSHPG